MIISGQFECACMTKRNISCLIGPTKSTCILSHAKHLGIIPPKDCIHHFTKTAQALRQHCNLVCNVISETDNIIGYIALMGVYGHILCDSCLPVKEASKASGLGREYVSTSRIGIIQETLLVR